jgi:hypothetical protein
MVSINYYETNEMISEIRISNTLETEGQQF